jgi:hypothetical protein
MLEPDALKGARPVLRRGGASNRSSLFDMYTDVEISCRFAQYYSLKTRWLLSYCPNEKMGGIFVYICGKWVISINLLFYGLSFIRTFKDFSYSGCCFRSYLFYFPQFFSISPHNSLYRAEVQKEVSGGFWPDI